MELKINVRESLDKGLSEDLTSWGFDRCGDIIEYSEKEKSDILAFRAREVLKYYFNNLKYAVKEINGMLTYKECIMLLDLTNSLLVTTHNNKQTLIDGLESYREFAPFADKNKVNSLIEKIEKLSEMQVHAIYFLCKQAWKEDNDTEVIIKKYFGVDIMDNLKIKELDKQQLAMAKEVRKLMECTIECENLGTDKTRYLLVHWNFKNEEYTTNIDYKNDDVRAGDYAQILDQTIMNSIKAIEYKKMEKNEESEEM